MRLALASDVMSALGLNDLPDYVNAVNEALDAATIQLESDMRVAFEQKACVDYFMPADNDPSTKLKLKKAFVQASPALAVTYAVSQGAWTLGETINLTSICKVDNDRGIVWVSGPDPASPSANGTVPQLFYPWATFGLNFPGFCGLKGAFLSVSYTAGFPADQADDESYDLTVVPKWLQSIARVVARISLADHPALQVTTVTSDVRLLQNQYAAMINAKSRYAPDAVLPKFSVESDP
jgi:hypothetical protein